MSQHDFILLDRSGSMLHNWQETLQAVNAYVKTLAEEETPTLVTLAVFDGQAGRCTFDVVRNSVAPKDWAPVNNSDAAPRGWTPLSDAIGKIVSLANAEPYEKVALIIMTDGEETGSTLTVPQAKRLLKECRDKGWQVIMLGADFDNTEQSRGLGNLAAQSATVSAGNMVGTMMATASLRGIYGSGAAQNMAYSPEQQAEWRKKAQKR